MNEVIVPPSPLWYKTAGLVCTPDNILIYGSQCDIVILKESGHAEAAEVKFISPAHSKCVISLSLNKNWNNPQAYLASLCKGGILKVWNVNTLTNIFEKTVHKEMVVGAIFSGDKKIVIATMSGVISVVDITTEETTTIENLFHEKDNVTCLSACPHKVWLIAFGLQSGNIVIADVRKWTRLHYLWGNHEPIITCSWCPATGNIFAQAVRNTVKYKADEAETLKNANHNLVHVDDKVYLKSSDVMEKFNVSEKSDPSEKCNIDQYKSDINPEKDNDDNEETLSTSELNEYYDAIEDFSDGEDITEEKDIGDEKQKDTKEDSLIENEKVPKTSEETLPENYLNIEEQKTEYLLASVGKDMMIHIWRAGTDGDVETMFEYPDINDMDDRKSNWISLCWVYPDRILTSTMHGQVLEWDLLKIRGLAIGIGIRDRYIRVWELGQSHLKTIAIHKYWLKDDQKVSDIAWHPKNDMIFAFGTDEGQIGFIDMSHKRSFLFKSFFNKRVYKVEWGPIMDSFDFGLYAFAEGNIVIYNMAKLGDDPIQLELPNGLYVYNFAWKPDFTMLVLNGTDYSLTVLAPDYSAISTVYQNNGRFKMIVWHPDSSFSNKFAVTTQKGVSVYECTLLKDTSSENVMNEIIKTFEWNLIGATAVAWSPHNGHLLATTDKDGRVLVFDVVTSNVISEFVDPFSYSAIIWSPLNPNLIILGHKMLTVFNISKHPPKNNVAGNRNLVAKATNTEPEKIKVKIPEVKSGTSSQMVIVKKYDKTDQQIPKSSTHINEEQKTEDKFKSCELNALMQGNIGGYIQTAIAENRVTRNLITLAPKVSLNLWQECCKSYAKKLSESDNSDPMEISTYFMLSSDS